MIPCLSTGLSRKTKIMLVLFSRLFGYFESLAFFEYAETKLTAKQSDRMFLVNFSKVQQFCNIFFFKKAQLF